MVNISVMHVSMMCVSMSYACIYDHDACIYEAKIYDRGLLGNERTEERTDHHHDYHPHHQHCNDWHDTGRDKYQAKYKTAISRNCLFIDIPTVALARPHHHHCQHHQDPGRLVKKNYRRNSKGALRQKKT